MSTLIYKVKKLMNLPLDAALKKVAVRSWHAVYYPLRKYRVRLMPIDMPDAYFEGFRSSCAFLFEPEKRAMYVHALHQMNQVQEIVADADRICDHTFNILGSGERQLGRKLPWNEDFKAKYRWKNAFYRDIPIIELHNHADVKVPWELSRFQHLMTLGKAYWLTQNEKYAQEFAEQITDWIQQNPIEMSVNWACTMDVAIRAVNWITGAYFFRESSISDSFWTRFNKSLFLHGQFIRNNLENEGEHTGNHYLSNLVGLVWLGLYFNSFQGGAARLRHSPEAWLTFGMTEMEKEMFVQVNTDGTNYEASTAYHRLVTELFLLTTILCSKNDRLFSSSYRKRLEKMCDFLLHITKPNGLSPLVGDADDGRLLILSRYSGWVRNDFRHLLAIAGEVFDRDDFRRVGQDYREDALWATGNVLEKALPAVSMASASFPDGGYYVLRNKRAYCLIRCGELSFRGHGTHSHNDQLSFELNADGIDFIIDPGTFVYTADVQMRNLFRSTGMHSTLQVGGEEQNDFREQELFCMKEQTFAECETFTASKFSGVHHGYKKSSGMIHKRQFLLYDDRLEIVDEMLPGDIAVEFELGFTFAPHTEIVPYNGLLQISRGGKSIGLTVKEYASMELVEGYASDRYGMLEKNERVRFRGSSAGQSILKTVIAFDDKGGCDHVDEIEEAP